MARRMFDSIDVLSLPAGAEPSRAIPGVTA
jgi:hypothetical protein